MRFLVDECTGPAVASWLREQKHEAFSVYEEARGMDDDDIIRKAFVENRILITNDRGFGEKVYREQCPHRGVVFLRLLEICNQISWVSCTAVEYHHHAPRLRGYNLCVSWLSPYLCRIKTLTRYRTT